MRNLHQETPNDNPSTFVGTVGRFGPFTTEFGRAIDVADNDYQPCRWYDVVPTNPDILRWLRQGIRVIVVFVRVLKGRLGYHPTILASLQLVAETLAPGQRHLH